MPATAARIPYSSPAPSHTYTFMLCAHLTGGVQPQHTVPTPSLSPPPRGGKFPHAYSLQHVVAHLCLAGDIARLEELILDFDFWENVYSAGKCTLSEPGVFTGLLDWRS